jgi:hypothetical protein
MSSARFVATQYWTPARFLRAGGGFLILIGAAGIGGVLGNISSAGFFHPPRWIDFLHLTVGAIALVVSYVGKRALQVALTWVPAIVATAIGFGGLVLGSSLAARAHLVELADLSDPIAHISVGLLALWALRNARAIGAATTEVPP